MCRWGRGEGLGSPRSSGCYGSSGRDGAPFVLGAGWTPFRGSVPNVCGGTRRDTAANVGVSFLGQKEMSLGRRGTRGLCRLVPFNRVGAARHLRGCRARNQGPTATRMLVASGLRHRRPSAQENHRSCEHRRGRPLTSSSLAPVPSAPGSQVRFARTGVDWGGQASDRSRRGWEN